LNAPTKSLKVVHGGGLDKQVILSAASWKEVQLGASPFYLEKCSAKQCFVSLSGHTTSSYAHR